MKRLITLLLALCCLLAPLSMSLAQEEKPVDAYEYFKDTKLDLEPYRGKAILLNFFTKWCRYCMQEMPEFKKVYESFNPDELQIILVHVWDGETEKETAEVAEAFGLQDMTFFEDEDLSLVSLANAPGYPHSVFIDKDGSLLGYISGATNYDSLVKVFADMGISPIEGAE